LQWNTGIRHHADLDFTKVARLPQDVQIIEELGLKDSVCSRVSAEPTDRSGPRVIVVSSYLVHDCPKDWCWILESSQPDRDSNTVGFRLQAHAGRPFSAFLNWTMITSDISSALRREKILDGVLKCQITTFHRK